MQPQLPAETPRETEFVGLGPVCRLGLASRGNTGLSAEAVRSAIERGVNYLNWCGTPNGMREAIRELGPRRADVKIAVQLESRSAAMAAHEMHDFFEELQTDYLDVVTYYYVEHPDEWRQITGPGGAAECIEALQRDGRVRRIGVTGHQRGLLAEIARGGRVEMLMVRYNAAHRGAETQVFPVAEEQGLPVVAFTCLRWGALLRPTSDDPPGFAVPPAADWYRFALAHPTVTVALSAPNGEQELAENLTLLDDWHSLSPERYQELIEHGDRVRVHAGRFP
jgi:predicted aldo/keto reductase-like oxidoreductase